MTEKEDRDKYLSEGWPAQDRQLTSEGRREALAAIAKFAKYTGPGIALLLASEQAVASGGDDGGDDCPFCE